jgi:PPOX class probable F420-dependent enzyme
MDDATLRQRLRDARVGHLATVTSSGRPHVVPCCFALDGERIVSAIDAKPKSTRALRRLENIRAHATAALLVDHYAEDWTTLWWIRVDAAARVAEGDDAHALAVLAEKYEQYAATPPRGPVIVLEDLRWTSWSVLG